MIKIVSLFASILLFNICISQQISFELASEGALQGADAGDVAFGDIDNDGDQDLLIAGRNLSIKTVLYTNDGNGNFTEIAGTPFPNAQATVGFTDINEDGFVDIYIGGATQGGLPFTHLYLNDQSSNFTFLTGTSFSNFRGGDFAFDDVDNDNDLDLLLSGSDNGAGFTRLYLNDGSENFTENLSVPFRTFNATAFELIDIEGDLDQDVIICGTDDNGVIQTLLFTNDGAGTYNQVLTHIAHYPDPIARRFWISSFVGFSLCTTDFNFVKGLDFTPNA